MACTSPASIVRSIPFRIGLPSTVACRFLISSMLRSDPRNTCRFELTDAAFQRDADQLLRLDGELHGELLHDLAAEAVHRSEEHTSELQSLMRISYAVFCLKKKQQPT